jgi:hypothetical protein
MEAIMSITTLAEAKAHLRVIDNDEDELIQSYIDAAEAHVRNYLERPLEPWTDEVGTAPQNIKQAILLVVGDFYENREARFVGTIQTNNPAFEALLQFDRFNFGL